MGTPVEDTYQLAGRVVGDRYLVEAPVARGGFGLVYRARHTGLDAPVALKVLTPPEHRADDAGLVERFRQEARTLAALRHPAIVRVLDVGALDGAEGVVWMALEWIDGVTLDHALTARAGRRHAPREVLDLLAPALDAVASAHAQGVAHRDLKPANLMLGDAPGGPAMRVLDFGIAKEMHPDEAPGSGDTSTRSEGSSFSLAYAAPEQVGGARTGPWTDVHALGLLVTELLVGRRAYAGEESFSLYTEIMAPTRPTPARHGVDVGPWEPVLAKALALHPGARYPRAEALREALEAALDGAQRAFEGAPAAPATPLAKARWRRALPAVVALAVAAPLVVASTRVDRPAAAPAPPSPRTPPPTALHPPTTPATAPAPPPAVTPAVTPAPPLAASPSPADAAVAGTRPRALAPRRGPPRAVRVASPPRDSDPVVVVE